MPTGQRAHVDELPIRELLEALVRHYHHLRHEHERASPGGATRRRVEHRLLEVRERFDRLLAEWVHDDDLVQQWRDHLHYRAPEPDGPAPIRPLVFRGQSAAGSVAEVHANASGELVLEIDGTPVERLADTDLPRQDSYELVRPGRLAFKETFTASPEALRELARFSDGGRTPPWDYAAELLADGLIDDHFALTPRGRRALVAHDLSM
jgi:hypothetical protein